MFVGLMALTLCLTYSFAGEKGSLRGRITDKKGSALKGAFVSITSPQLLGVKSYLTHGTGHYVFPGLSAGTYKILVETPGYKTMVAQGVVLIAGQNLVVDYSLEATEVEEAVPQEKAAPWASPDSAVLTTVIDSALLNHIPLARDLSAIMGLMPGFVFKNNLPSTAASVLGSPEPANMLTRDDINVTDPVTGSSMSRMNPDVIEGIVLESAGNRAASGPGQGAQIRIISRTGTNKFSGSLSHTHSAKSYNKNLWSDQEVADLGGPAQGAPFRNSDFSLAAAGPVIEDYVWIFAAMRAGSRSYTAPVGPWTDPIGLSHDGFSFTDRSFSYLMKFTGRFNSNLNLGFQLDYERTHQPYYEGEIDYYRTEGSTRGLSNEKYMAADFYANYTLSKNTFIDVRMAYASQKKPLVLNSETAGMAEYYDIASGYTWGSGDYNDNEKRSRVGFNASITHFLDNFLGLGHRLSAGADYDAGASASSVWKENPFVYYFSGNSAYVYGFEESPYSGETVGKGLIGIRITPDDDGGLSVKREVKRLGVHVSDTIELGNRVSLDLGLRYDRAEANFLGITKSTTGNDLAVSIGDTLLDPLIGLNPFSSASISAWDGAIVWNNFSPRAGISVDLFGKGLTMLKASYARIPENLTVGYTEDITPFPVYTTHYFYWYDEDGDVQVDDSDTYSMLSSDYRIYSSWIYKQAVNPDLEAPIMDEWTVGLEQRLFSDFTVSARYINRTYKNQIGYLLYDPSTSSYWYDKDDSPDGWWVPYTTTVPGTDGAAATEVTVYLPSTDSPDSFYRLDNMEDLHSTYKGVEMTVKKDMSHNWQFFGSLVLSKTRGTTSLASTWAGGTSRTTIGPNSFYNISDNSTLAYDRPFNLRLMGTYRFPMDIYLSANFQAVSGTTWARTVTVVPDDTWCAANGAVAEPVSLFLEEPGSRRYPSWSNLDMRLEKDFVTRGKARFALSVDVFNLLGNKYKVIDQNAAGLWLAGNSGTASGIRVISDSYGKAIVLRGTRIFQLNLKVNF